MVDKAMAAEAGSISLLSWEERIYRDVDVGKAIISVCLVKLRYYIVDE
jgi:hypothetical protein